MGDQIARSNKRVTRLIGLAIALIFLFAVKANVRAQSNFYSGKTVTVVVGSAPGGLYDLWARLFARTMGKYIPGNPTMWCKTCPAAV